MSLEVFSDADLFVFKAEGRMVCVCFVDSKYTKARMFIIVMDDVKQFNNVAI